MLTFAFYVQLTLNKFDESFLGYGYIFIGCCFHLLFAQVLCLQMWSKLVIETYTITYFNYIPYNRLIAPWSTYLKLEHPFSGINGLFIKEVILIDQCLKNSDYFKSNTFCVAIF